MNIRDFKKGQLQIVGENTNQKPLHITDFKKGDLIVVKDGLKEKFADSIQKGREKYNKSLDRYVNDEQSILEHGLQTIGTGIGTATDMAFKTVGALASKITPDAIEKPVTDAVMGGLRAVAQSAPGQVVGQAVSSIYDPLSDRTKANLGAVGEIASLLPAEKLFSAGGKAVSAAAPAIKTAAVDIGEAAAKGVAKRTGSVFNAAKNTVTDTIPMFAKKTLTPEDVVRYETKFNNSMKNVVDTNMPLRNYVTDVEKQMAGKNNHIDLVGEMSKNRLIPEVHHIDGVNVLKTKDTVVPKIEQDIKQSNELMDDLLKTEIRTVDVEDFRQRILSRIRSADPDKDAQIADFINKKIDAIAQRQKGRPLTLSEVQEIKKEFSKKVNFGNPDTYLGDKNYAISRAARDIIEEYSEGDLVKQLNKQQAKYITLLEFAEKLDGKRVGGGKFSRHFSRLAGTAAGAQAGGVFGAFIGNIGSDAILDILDKGLLAGENVRNILASIKRNNPEIYDLAKSIVEKRKEQSSQMLRLGQGAIKTPVPIPAPQPMQVFNNYDEMQKAMGIPQRKIFVDKKDIIDSR